MKDKRKLCRYCQTAISDLSEGSSGVHKKCSHAHAVNVLRTYANSPPPNSFGRALPAFDWDVVTVGASKVLRIWDIGEGVPCVTNNMQFVITYIQAAMNELPKFIVYQDLQGNWDRVQVHENEFCGFSPIIPGVESDTYCGISAVQLVCLNHYNTTGVPH
ncbi:hypothetical protein [Enterovibrio norvegicus]|uniref:hypothetical protein n=1 Tax=Enterovibrio norvegicus TaxID=188144 RepID=UPI00352C837A